MAGEGFWERWVHEGDGTIVYEARSVGDSFEVRDVGGPVFATIGREQFMSIYRKEDEVGE